MNEYFETLGCAPDDPPDVLRRAWRGLCLKHHPDKGGDEAEFIKVTHAYRMLSDPSYRRQQAHRPVRDLTFRVQLMVSFIDAFYGTRMVVGYNRIVVNDKLEQVRTGEAVEPISIAFDIPPGSTGGFKHEVPDMGLKFGNEAGKAVIQVRSEQHPRYKIEGLDVMVEEEVPLEALLKGAHVIVDTLWGHRTLWVPPGTIPGEKLRVVGCGVHEKGHQYCTVKPVYPSETDLKNKPAWRGLGINWQKAEDENKQDDDLFKKFEELKKET